MHAVELENVTKTFGSTAAVDALSLSVPQGSIYGFIGPNGSGKTTTLRMIMRILHPDRGAVRVFGQDVTHGGAASDRIGYLPEERGLYRKVPVGELLRFHAELNGVAKPQVDIDAWLERLGLADCARKKLEALSKGMAQKIQFIATVLHRPELLVLDEPFAGLDPVNLDVLRHAVLDQRRAGATVIFSTHDMSVAERLCDFIFMIHRGRKVLDGTLAEIKDRYGRDTLHVQIEGNDVRLAELNGVTEVHDLGQRQELRLRPDTEPQDVLRQLVEHARVRHFEVAHPTLHDIFVRIATPGDPEPEHA